MSFDISLAGNFGEPRPNHFHGGIDVKTQHEEGKPVHSIGDGYVCKVSVSTGGYGNAVFVRHPDGYTSVYAHLQQFAPAIEAKVKQWQYNHKSWEGEIPFSATDFPVVSGQVIALSGNTGASMGPHLHLEIHQTDTWDMYDPLEFLPEGVVKDGRCPEATAIMAYPQQGEGSFCGMSHKVLLTLKDGHLPDSLTAWGKVGFAICADDFMEGSSNHYGIRYTSLFVDGVEVFHSDVNGIPSDMNRMVNSWGDYDEFKESKRWFMKSFVEPGNLLPFLTTDQRKGYIFFQQEKIYLLKYVLKDFFGNERVYEFRIAGKKQVISQDSISEGHRQKLKWDEENNIDQSGVKLNIPKGCLPDNIVLTVGADTARWSGKYSFVDKSTPLFHYADIALRIGKHVVDTTKLYITADGTYLGGNATEEGWVRTTTRDLGGVFSLGYDNLPPVISAVDKAKWIDSGNIIYEVKDTLSGVDRVEGAIDGLFVLFEPIPHSRKYICRLKKTPVKKIGKQRSLEFVVWDRRNNKQLVKDQINY
ncbi:MAG: M23 family metallopeptidase [Prevotella sp.]|nr:M23 family metallopeptidase [Prevotella sp.]